LNGKYVDLLRKTKFFKFKIRIFFQTTRDRNNSIVTKSGEKAGEKVEGKAGEKVEGKAGEKVEGKAEEKVEEKAGKAEEKAGKAEEEVDKSQLDKLLEENARLLKENARLRRVFKATKFNVKAENGPKSILDLPEEILLFIMTFLSLPMLYGSVALVC
jgi:hypothetical protein